MNPDTTYENFIYTTRGTFPSIDIITLSDKKKKKKRNESIIRGVLTEGRFVSLNISINSIDSGIFRLDKKRECLNRGIEVIMLIFHNGLESTWAQIKFYFSMFRLKIGFWKINYILVVLKFSNFVEDGISIAAPIRMIFLHIALFFESY